MYVCRLSVDCVDFGLIIDGATLSALLKPTGEAPGRGGSSSYRDVFLEVCRHCSAVLCCRMAPLQKAQVSLHLWWQTCSVSTELGCSVGEEGVKAAAVITLAARWAAD